MPTKPKSLVTKLTEIAEAIGSKDPERHSSEIPFAYHAARDVYGWWRSLLHEQNILLVPRARNAEVTVIEKPGRNGKRTVILTTVMVDFAVFDGETGEVLEGSAVGQGEDGSDKGSGKAMTYAEKAFLLGMGMNGAEQDVEERAAQADYDGAVVIEDSAIEGIEKGGRPTTTTEVQVTRFRQLARDIGYGPTKAAGLLKDILGAGPDMPEEPDEAGPALIKYVSGLKSEDMGKVITYMEKMKE